MRLELLRQPFALVHCHIPWSPYVISSDERNQLNVTQEHRLLITKIDRDRSRRRLIAYWIATGIIAAEFAVGGVMDLLRLPPFFAIAKHLGYPDYFPVILGFWKVLGVAAVLAPRFPILKEWAYAGMFFTMTGAAVSHVAVGDPIMMLVAPIIFTGLVAASWALRPVAQRDNLVDSGLSLPRPHRRLLGGYRAPRPRVWSGRSDGSLAITTIPRDYGAPWLPALSDDYPRRLVSARRSRSARPGFSPSQGVGLRGLDLYLHRSDRLPTGSG
jgi:hypothetical protein